MNSEQIRKLFYALLVTVTAAGGFATWLTLRTIGGIEVIETASNELELRRFRIAARLRAQVQRLSASMLRHQVTGEEVHRQRFARDWTLLQAFVEEHRPLLDTNEEKALLLEIEAALEDYHSDAVALMSARPTTPTPGPAAEQLERNRSALDEIIELSNTLGDARKEAFRKLLADYRVSARGLQRSILGALGLLLAALAGLTWLAYRAFFAPLQGELREARTLAGRREELANIGTLASGIAHEIRNPLTAMKARAYALKALVDDPKAIAQATVIEGEIDRLERVVRSVLDFARPAELEPTTTRLDDYLQEIRDLVEPELTQKHVTIATPRRTGLIAHLDPAQMKQVLLNLLRNAAEACPKAGGAVELGANSAAAGVTLFVRDNGSGIPEEYHERLFEPFYSKKAAGTGLGLSIARNIVRKHGGDLTFTTAPGQGTTFFIHLPR